MSNKNNPSRIPESLPQDPRPEPRRNDQTGEIVWDPLPREEQEKPRDQPIPSNPRPQPEERRD
jgi:hypothetical protein